MKKNKIKNVPNIKYNCDWEVSLALCKEYMFSSKKVWDWVPILN